MRLHALTVAGRGDLGRARVLARSVRRHHPDWVTCLCPTGRGGPAAGDAFDRVLDPGGAGAAILDLLRGGAEGVACFDPGSVLLGPLPEAEALLARHGTVLTPRAAEGIGLLALRDAESARGWAAAWPPPAAHAPRPDPPPGAAVLRHPGYDLAFAELDRVPVAMDPDGALRVAGAEARLLHMGDAGAGAGTVAEAVLDRLPPGRTEPLDLLRWYRAALEEERVDASPRDPDHPPMAAPGPDAARRIRGLEYQLWQSREIQQGIETQRAEEVAALRARLGDAMESLRGTEEARRTLRERLERIEGSTSWRLTAPLRHVLMRVRGGS